MAKQRYINTRFWSDNFIAELNPLDRYLFLYFLTNEHTNICGIYEVPLKTISFETGLELDMLKKMFKRLDGKIFYIDGWVYIKNFAKHQAVNDSISKGIRESKKNIPDTILEKIKKIEQAVPTLYTASPQAVGYLNPNSNLNPNSIVASDTPFSLKEEIGKLENSEKRELNIIALYLEHRKPDLQNREQYNQAIKRHIKSAITLKPFTDNQILKALDYAKKEYKDIYTLETLNKILTK